MRCRVRAEGRPFEALYGGDVPNHRVLRWLKTVFRGAFGWWVRRAGHLTSRVVTDSSLIWASRLRRR